MHVLKGVLDPGVNNGGEGRAVLFHVVIVRKVLCNEPVGSRRIGEANVPIATRFVTMVVVDVVEDQASRLGRVSFRVLLPGRGLVFWVLRERSTRDR